MPSLQEVLNEVANFGRLPGTTRRFQEPERVGPFVLLPSGSPPPEDIQLVRNDGLPVDQGPTFCSVADAEEDDPGSHINVTSGDHPPTLEELGEAIAFPGNITEIINELPEHLNSVDVEIIRYTEGALAERLISASATFRPAEVEWSIDQHYPFIHLSIIAEFPLPYPFWDGYDEEGGDQGPTVVDFLRVPALMNQTPSGGYTLYWIQNDTLYTLHAEGDNRVLETAIGVARFFAGI